MSFNQERKRRRCRISASFLLQRRRPEAHNPQQSPNKRQKQNNMGLQRIHNPISLSHPDHRALPRLPEETIKQMTRCAKQMSPHLTAKKEKNPENDATFDTPDELAFDFVKRRL